MGTVELKIEIQKDGLMAIPHVDYDWIMIIPNMYIYLYIYTHTHIYIYI